MIYKVNIEFRVRYDGRTSRRKRTCKITAVRKETAQMEAEARVGKIPGFVDVVSCVAVELNEKQNKQV